LIKNFQYFSKLHQALIKIYGRIKKVNAEKAFNMHGALGGIGFP